MVRGNLRTHLRSRERLTDKAVITRQGLDQDPNAGFDDSTTAVTDEFPLVEFSESSPRQGKSIVPLDDWIPSHDARFLMLSTLGSRTTHERTDSILNSSYT
jgi:hypothetical protein